MCGICHSQSLILIKNQLGPSGTHELKTRILKQAKTNALPCLSQRFQP